MGLSRSAAGRTPAAGGSTRRGRKASASGNAEIPEKLVRTAARLFAKNGYHATGMAELCDAAGIGRGTMYYYVDGKETLLYEICRAEVVKMDAQAAEIAAMSLPADEKLRLLARSLMVNIAEHLNEWTVFFKEFGGLTAARRSHIIAARQEYEEQWLQVLNEGVAAGLFRASRPLMVKGLLGMFNYAYLWFRPKGEASAEEVADSFLDAVLNGLLVAPHPSNGAQSINGRISVKTASK